MKTLDYSGLAGPIVTVKILDSTSTTGGAKTGLTNASASLNIAVRPDNAATTTAYTSAGSTIDTITTLGTWAAPTTGHCRFSQIDATNHPGHYELQFSTSLWQTSGARKLVGTVLVTGGVQTDFEIELTQAVDLGAAAAGTAAVIPFGTGSGQLNVSGGNLAGAVPSVTGSVGSVAGSVTGDVQGKVLGGGASSITGVGAQSNCTQIAGSTTAATNLSATAQGVFLGQVSSDATPTTTSFTSNTSTSPGLSTTTGFYSTPQQRIVFYSGANAGKCVRIASSGYTYGTFGTFTLMSGDALPTAPSSGDKYFIIAETP
jgi:hypothetical protein